MIFLFPGNKGVSLYLGIFGFLLAMYQVIKIIIISQSLIDDFFPTKNDERVSDALPNQIIYNSAMTIFVCGLISIYSQITPLENTVRGGRFFLWSSIIGLFVGVALIFAFKSKFPTLLNQSDRRFVIVCGFIIGFFLLVPAIANLLNSRFSSGKTDCVELPVAQKFTEGTNNSSFHVRMKIDGREEKFEITRETFDVISVGDSLNLCIKHGLMGYDFIEGFPSISHK